MWRYKLPIILSKLVCCCHSQNYKTEEVRISSEAANRSSALVREVIRQGFERIFDIENGQRVNRWK